MNTKIRIISVDAETDSNVENFGLTFDEKNKKARYRIRRKVVLDLIKNNPDLNIEIFDAITPNKFKLENSKIYYKDNIFDSKDNSIFYAANMLSHYNIWLMDEDTLVLEDDIKFDVNLLHNIETTIQNFKNNTDTNGILYLQKSIPWLKDAPSSPLNCMDYSGTGALFLTKECKKILLNNIKPFCGCDGYLSELNNKNIIKYYLPNSLEEMFELDNTKHWL
jgi:GR25 family glycosyltransferase involved in LPS biosynthesis